MPTHLLYKCICTTQILFSVYYDALSSVRTYLEDWSTFTMIRIVAHWSCSHLPYAQMCKSSDPQENPCLFSGPFVSWHSRSHGYSQSIWYGASQVGCNRDRMDPWTDTRVRLIMSCDIDYAAPNSGQTTSACELSQSALTQIKRIVQSRSIRINPASNAKCRQALS